MTLWLLRPVGYDPFDDDADAWGENKSWNCALGFVVRAAHPTEARMLASAEAGNEGAAAWLDPVATTCEELAEDGAADVIIRDFLHP